MVTLVWWGVALPTLSTADEGWMAAVQDVGWVLTGLLSASSSMPISTNASHVLPPSMSISIGTSRKRRR
ncbi:uncharacterized protein LACBIDRAFT_299200 [Laccaria bicolor S238N-H82]|uniref:Predicted protein n=1 Tax=Laccaria bicolor (strain S238N-H82 / ATCC MYA-4686) TaxID=486041 RepID=B0E3N6_LACBS|nr:uncharacterized protein LACBIDRAFT_299200 [Laccaria bicolor S238N-H82]EDQ98547.1 predicted protein [Laccaria bicolor S238N-H82]|eukprot:XP_001890802.1 predicted protein [Laccaria bicolor S238N-H82]